jgi:hypothetical protein
MSSPVYVDDKATVTDVIELEVEEVEEVIAPRLSANHNATLAGGEVELSVEEIEEVIAPRLSANHNQTLLSD